MKIVFFFVEERVWILLYISNVTEELNVDLFLERNKGLDGLYVL